MRLNKDNFDGEWKFIPRYNNRNSQLILTKDYFGQKIGCNFNFDEKESVLGRPVSLINVLLDLDKEKIFKRIIRSNSSIEFIVMNDNEIRRYEEAMQRNRKKIDKN